MPSSAFAFVLPAGPFNRHVSFSRMHVYASHMPYTPPTYPSGPLAVRIRHACDVDQTYGRVCTPVDAAIVACVLWTPFFCLRARSIAGHVSVGGYPEIVSISEPCCSTSKLAKRSRPLLLLSQPFSMLVSHDAVIIHRFVYTHVSVITL